MNLPFLKQRADVVNALANLGTMPPVLTSRCAYYQLMPYDIYPADFRVIAESLGVDRMGHALRDRSLRPWMKVKAT